MKKIQSTCNYCAIDCNLDFYVEENRVVKVVPTARSEEHTSELQSLYS